MPNGACCADEHAVNTPSSSAYCKHSVLKQKSYLLVTMHLVTLSHPEVPEAPLLAGSELPMSMRRRTRCRIGVAAGVVAVALVLVDV